LFFAYLLTITTRISSVVYILLRRLFDKEANVINIVNIEIDNRDKEEE